MEPRATIEQIQPSSSAKDKLLPGDVVERLTYEDGGDTVDAPTVTEVRERLAKAGETSQAKVDFIINCATIKQVEVTKRLKANVRLPPDRKGVMGLNVALSLDEQHPGRCRQRMEKSDAANAGIPSGATITAIDDQPVKTWYDVKRLYKRRRVGGSSGQSRRDYCERTQRVFVEADERRRRGHDEHALRTHASASRSCGAP